MTAITDPTEPFATRFTPPLGWEVQSEWHPNADVIGTVSLSGTGNVVIRAGQRLPEGGWESRLHIVLSQDEARALEATLAWLTAATPMTKQG